jgi:hypothetical protein
MKRFWLAAAVSVLPVAHIAAAAEAIDCSTPIAKAQKSLDKVTGDLQGMDKMMAKNEMSEIRGLVGEAQKLLAGARQHCTKGGPYDRARGIARADAADGYATAADILHFHYMEAMGGGMAGDHTPAPQGGMASHDMGGMSGSK